MPASDIPAESERVYYREWCASGDVVAESRSILAELLEEEIEIDAAWFPVHCSPCECVMCTSGIVLLLEAADDRVLGFDFRSDNPWALNCGVPTLWHFDFP